DHERLAPFHGPGTFPIAQRVTSADCEPRIMPNQDLFDVAVVGGGVVGCAVARRLTLDGARVLLLERGADILSGASKANSALLHTGYDAPPDSLELACMKAGYREYLEIRESMNLPLLETDAMVVAWNDEDFSILDAI